MSVFRRLGAASPLIFVVLLVAAAPAAAELGSIRLVSKTVAEQAAEATEPALSTDGRYLAFQATIGGLEGVFREDLSSGAIVPVVAGSAFERNSPGSDASAPSISADGRYVSFTTSARLAPVDDPQASSPDVYVADLNSSPPRYELASALDGSTRGLTYGGRGGSEASGRVALSGDGRKVVFYTTAESDLGGHPGDTPAGQVVLRDLATRRTILVSVERDAETGAMTDLPVQGGALIEQPQVKRLKGAALSADGTTVAWLGAHLPAQVPLLADEREQIARLDSNGEYPYDEPLWRRIADGPDAPTRRIVGGGDPLAPGCPEGGTLADPTCRGPFPELAKSREQSLDPASTGWLGAQNVSGVPALSADGRTVALVGNPIGATNLFLVDMRDGLARREAVRPLTREVPVNSLNPEEGVNTLENIPLNGHIFDLAISADGRRIAFATARQQFPLAPPNLITSIPAGQGLTELYLIDREGETLRRVTHGDGGADEPSLAMSGAGLPLEPSSGLGATSPSFGLGGRLLAFASDASNLVEGDGNDAPDAFVVEDDEASRLASPPSISPSPPPPRVRRRWRLVLNAFSLPNGRVRLVAVVPGSGKLRVRAWGKLKPEAKTRRLARSGRRTRRPTGGKLKLTLKLPRRLRRLAHTREGIYAIARASFHHRGRRVLRGRLQVRFHAHRVKRRHGRHRHRRAS